LGEAANFSKFRDESVLIALQTTSGPTAVVPFSQSVTIPKHSLFVALQIGPWVAPALPGLYGITGVAYHYGNIIAESSTQVTVI
jgi:hypothetical protein